MGTPKAPDPPDPKETAAAQTGTNVATAIANTQLGNVNQFTPQGSLTYDQSGEYSWTDPSSGATYTVPKFTANTTYSPEQQAIYDQTSAADLNTAKIANNQSAFLNEYLSKPVKLDNEATEARLFELGSKRLYPAFAREQQRYEASLSNRGLKMGSDDYDDEMMEFRKGKNDAYNQLLLTGRSQAANELLTERNQPINEITALLSSSQVQQPQFQNTSTAQIPTTDYAGLVQDNYQAELANYQREQQSKNQLLGGLFGLGSSAIMMSDRRLKKDIKKVGKTDDGQQVYAYRYKAGGPMQLGLMAQDVEKKNPDAVVEMADGMKGVDYGKALRLGAK